MRQPKPPRLNLASPRHARFLSPMAPWICLATLGGWLLAHPGVALGQSGLPEFDAAYRAQAMEEYAQAANGYEQIIAQHGYSAPVLFNLANAYVQQGQVGLAILNYERARWLTPRDPDIRANLRLAREQSGLTPPAEAWWTRAAGILSGNAWARLGSSSLILLCLAVLARRLSPRLRRTLLVLQLGSILTMLCSGAAMAARAQQLDRGVVVQSADALLSPVPGARTAFSLAEGEMVSIGQGHGDFVLARTLQGRFGWVEAGRVKAVVPPGP